MNKIDAVKHAFFLCLLLTSVACGSSASLSAPSETSGLGGSSGGAASTATLTTADAGDASLLPVVTTTDAQNILLDCSGISDGDPATDIVTVTCALDAASAVYDYYCVSGIVTREIQDSSSDPVTLFEVTGVICSDVDGTPTLTEEEPTVS